MRFTVRLLGLYPFNFDDKGNSRVNWWASLRSCSIVFGSCIFTVVITYVDQTTTTLSGSVIYHFRRECFAFFMVLSHCLTFYKFKETEKVEKMLASVEKSFRKKDNDKDHWLYMGSQVVANIIQQVATTSAYGNMKIASNVAMNLILYGYATSFEATLNRIIPCSVYLTRRLAFHPSRRVVTQRLVLVEASRAAMRVYSFKVLSSLLVCFVFIVANLDYVIGLRTDTIGALVVPILYTASYGYLIGYIIVKPCVEVIYEDNNFRELLLANYLRGIKSMPLAIIKRTLSSSERIKFEPWGLFELDFKLITSMLSLASSYLLIVMQIQN